MNTAPQSPTATIAQGFVSVWADEGDRRTSWHDDEHSAQAEIARRDAALRAEWPVDADGDVGIEQRDISVFAVVLDEQLSLRHLDGVDSPIYRDDAMRCASDHLRSIRA